MNQESKHDLKEKIRQRYKGGDVENMHLIPARAKESLFDESTEKKVCAYCRVSTDDPRQTSSYELQKNHYEEFISLTRFSRFIIGSWPMPEVFVFMVNLLSMFAQFP